jgi:uncharacterized protein
LKARLLSFIDALRTAGLRISVAEALDSLHAVAVIGIEPTGFREALASALVKDEADRALFDATFDRFFAPAASRRAKRAREPAGTEGEGGGRAKAATQSGSRTATKRPESEPIPRRTPAVQQGERVGRQERRPASRAQKLARQKALLDIPFQDMSPPEIEECDELAAALARRFRANLSRRQRQVQRGRLDLRRTVRRSISTGGVPINPAFRHRQPGRPDLIALCDCSHSVATASRFLLALLAPAQEFFRRVRLFAFVDQPVEVSIESGNLVPHSTLDLYARSDFGKVLVGFWERWEPLLTRNTIVLILGDARNNRRPPRADILARIHGAARRVVWLNPESVNRWDGGDSVMRTYARHCDVLLAASNLRELLGALQRSMQLS